MPLASSAVKDHYNPMKLWAKFIYTNIQKCFSCVHIFSTLSHFVTTAFKAPAISFYYAPKEDLLFFPPCQSKNFTCNLKIHCCWSDWCDRWLSSSKAFFHPATASKQGSLVPIQQLFSLCKRILSRTIGMCHMEGNSECVNLSWIKCELSINRKL